MVAFKGNPDFLKEARGLQVRVYDKAVDKHGGVYANAQLDHRDPQAQGQTNLNLSTKFPQKGDRFQKPSNDVRYTSKQMDKIKEAAGDNVYRDEERGLTVYGVKAHLTSVKSTPGLIVNTKEDMGPSDFHITKESIEGQFSAMKAAQEAKKAQQNQAQQAAPQADAPQVTESQPQAVGVEEPEL